MAIAEDLRHDAIDLAEDALAAAAVLAEDAWASGNAMARDAKDAAVDLGGTAVEKLGDLPSPKRSSSSRKTSFPWRVVALVVTAVGLGALVFWMARRRKDRTSELAEEPVADSEAVATALESTDRRRATG